MAIILSKLAPRFFLPFFFPFFPFFEEEEGPEETIAMPDNKALHQTRRGGAAHFVRRGPVVEARLAGEGRCWTDASNWPQ